MCPTTSQGLADTVARTSSLMAARMLKGNRQIAAQTEDGCRSGMMEREIAAPSEARPTAVGGFRVPMTRALAKHRGGDAESCALM
mmetsp:Transcript_57758/g.135335  ORF Transcript_57758/g.135335 Transcript_57758/m.135335 type:complete len:85 (+) Transcript_57758:128-382(+)